MRKIFLLVAVLVASCVGYASAQQDRKLEVGALYSVQGTRGHSSVLGQGAAQGFGGRISYNFTDHFALEAETQYLPSDPTSLGVFGPKVGLRRGRIGLFGKVRPGFLWMRDRNRCPGSTVCYPAGFPLTDKTTSFALDLGGVVEFYQSTRLFFRVDMGDFVAPFDHTRILVNDDTPLPYPYRLVHHNLQFGLGVGYRF